MNSEEDKFNLAFKSYGGIYNFSRQNSTTTMIVFALTRIRWHLDIIRKQKEMPFPEIFISAVNNSRFGAKAIKFEGKYYIGIYIGTIKILEYLFMRILSSPNILKDLGDVSLEVHHDKIFSARISDENHIIDDFVRPNCEKRRSLALQLISQAVHYLFLHELAHIRNGHLDLLDYLPNDSNLLVQAMTNKKEFIPLVSQTLEMDADAAATLLGTQQIEFICSNQWTEGFLHDFFIVKDQSVALWAFSVMIVWSISNFGEKESEINILSSHPGVGVRGYIVSNMIQTIYPNDDKLLDMAGEYMGEALKAFLEISESKFHKQSFTVEKERKFTAFLTAYWNNVRPFLEPYAFCALAPYKEF